MKGFGPLARPLLVALACLWAIPSETEALFEDQAFKFDWRQQYVGVATQARLWETQRDAALIVRTDSGVLAALDADTGALRWRHVGEDDEKLLALRVNGERSVATVAMQKNEGAGAQVAMRTWSPMNGALLTEKVLEPSVQPDAAAFVYDGEAYLVGADEKGGVRVAVYNMKKGTEGMKTTFSTAAGERVQCLDANEVLVCFSPKTRTVYYTALPLESSKGSFNMVPLNTLGMPDDATPLTVTTIPGAPSSVRVSMKTRSGGEELMVINFKEGKMSGAHVIKNEKSRSVRMLTGCKNTDDFLSVEQECSDETCMQFKQNVKVSKISAKTKQSAYNVDYTFSRSRGRVVEGWATCSGDDDSFQLVIQNEDGSLTSISPSAHEVWVREEALADIRKVELVSKAQEAGEESGNVDSGDVLGQFVRRLKRHAALLNTAFTRFLELKELAAQSSSFLTTVGGGDTSDSFGIHKVIVALTGNGNVIAIDSKNGEILWKRFFAGIDGKNDPFAKMLVLRSSDHFGLDPRFVLTFRDKRSDVPTIVSFNPHTGDIISTKPMARDLTQVIPLHHTDAEHLRPLLLLFKDQRVQLEPESAKSSVSAKSFIVTLDAETGLIRGQKLSILSDRVKLTPLWTLSNPGAKVLHIEGKPSDETVHSQGRVMADRSVLFKYINPNLGLILSEGDDAAGKPFINVYLVDLVTGKVVFSANHKRVHGPYHVVHSENWAVYSYYNEKARRGEITSLELFEGNTQSNNTVFSSLSSDVAPLVERQAYILGPTHVMAIKDTRTEKGITSKNLLMATNNGFVYNVPRHILDPRRPNINTPPEMREPGLPPYIPELALPPETVLNYNQTLARPAGVVTAPTGLESTSVAFVYGLDLYCTRVTPSKGFDVLKEDFDYYVISLVLMALVGAAYATRRLSQRKNLKQAWR